ncbi:MAG: DUF4167 domain-containing protein [Rhodospirillales bacterium]|nr:MAG: DUF4167 domain-containing protein [Rhodospirillales bacterium]
MKQNSSSRRLRGRGNGKRHTTSRNQTFESNGPEGKIRGSAQQVLERYLALGRDASSSGDPIAAEGFFQHAEHYYRLISADAPADRGNGAGAPGQPRRPGEPTPDRQAGSQASSQAGDAVEPGSGEDAEQVSC